jgi:hypothetical protein
MGGGDVRRATPMLLASGCIIGSGRRQRSTGRCNGIFNTGRLRRFDAVGVASEIREVVAAEVVAARGLRLSFRDIQGAATRDDVNRFGNIYVHLKGAGVMEPDKVRVFPNREAPFACRHFENHLGGRRPQFVQLAPGATIKVDGGLSSRVRCAQQETAKLRAAHSRFCAESQFHRSAASPISFAYQFSNLSEKCPDLCRAKRSRYLRCQKERTREREREQLLNEAVCGITQDPHAKGLIPTEPRIMRLLSKGPLKHWGAVRRAIKIARHY